MDKERPGANPIPKTEAALYEQPVDISLHPVVIVFLQKEYFN
jgi:hypothetical protein